MQSLRIFFTLYVAYLLYYLAKKNYSFWIQYLQIYANLNKTELGMIQSTFEGVSAIAKLGVGIFVDSYDPARMLVLGLFISGLCNVLYCYTQYNFGVMLFTVAMNGIAQSIGWPALAKIFLTEYAASENKGALYSVLSTSQNAGSALVPIILLPASTYWGSDTCVSMWLPGSIAIGFSFILWVILPRYDAQDLSKKSDSKTDTRSPADLFRNTIGNLALTLLGAMYFFVSFVRSGVMDWSNIYLSETKGYSGSQAASAILCLEIGGFVGGLAAGIISDTLYNGNRSPVMVLFCSLSIFSVASLWVHYSVVFSCISFFAIGVCTCAPHVLVGLHSREIVDPSFASTAGGYVKFVGQLGNAVAGYPLGLLVHSFGWTMVTFWYVLSCLLAVLSVSLAQRLAYPPKSKIT